MSNITRNMEKIRSGRTSLTTSLNDHQEYVKQTLSGLEDQKIMERLWNHDHTIWKNDPEEISNRLGWLSSPVSMKGFVDQIGVTVARILEEGYTDALLLGMGGSSLAPDLFAGTFPKADGYLNLTVLDSTDPAAVLDRVNRMDPERTMFVVSTKSGTTQETLSLFRFFFNRTVETAGRLKAGRQFMAITDPGSPLQALASDLGFRETYVNDPDIGGRYSALTFFGLVPAALMGIDIALLLDRATAMAGNCKAENSPVHGDNTGGILGGILGSLHNAGMDKLTFITSPAIAPLGAWLEQLIAESTGKEGKGIVPVDGEIPGGSRHYGKDRLFVYLKLSGDSTYDEIVSELVRENRPVVQIEIADLHDLGGEFFRWEVATAVAGHIMGINPFDQPNVESAKKQTRRMLDRYLESGKLPALAPSLDQGGLEIYSDIQADSLNRYLHKYLGQAQPGDYVAFQAYVNPTPETAFALGEFRQAIRRKVNTATTVGFGPRFLHSTGQLHKGDGGKGLFIQITADDVKDFPIPDKPGSDESTITFGVLKAAQAMGDRQALMDAGRRVIRIHFKGDVVEGINMLKEAVD